MDEIKLFVSLPLDELQRAIGIIEGAASGIVNQEAQSAIFDTIESLDMMIDKAQEERL